MLFKLGTRRFIAYFAVFLILLSVSLSAWHAQMQPELVFYFATEDGKNTLTYSCKVAESETANKSIAEQAHSVFQTKLRLILEETATKMQEAILVASSSGIIPDLITLEDESFDQRRALVAEIREQFGCAVAQAE